MRESCLILVLLVLVGCEAAKPRIQERPVVNVPKADRQANWGSGSCVHACMVSLFRWQHRYSMADYWRRTYSGGESRTALNAKLEQAGVRWADTIRGDVSFLEWSVRTRRGCAVVVDGGRHMVCLVHLDSKYAAVLDNNKVGEFIWVSRDELIKDWQVSGGWAVTVIYSPAAPLP